MDRYSDALAGVTILLVEDHRGLRELYLLMLGLCGADLHAVTSCEDAVAVLQGGRPHAVVMDACLPDPEFTLVTLTHQLHVPTVITTHRLTRGECAPNYRALPHVRAIDRIDLDAICATVRDSIVTC